VGRKVVLQKQRCLAIGLLSIIGIMGTSIKSMADTAIHAAHHVDTSSVNNYNFPTNATIAEDPCFADENDVSDAPVLPEWTKRQCRKAFKHNTKLCNSSPPALKLPCIAAALLMYRRCLKNAH
jgi:hypothetical protein